MILALRYAKRGTGTTAMDGAVRARLVPNIESRTSRAGYLEIAGRRFKVGATPQWVIESENFEDVIAAITGLLDSQTLVLGYLAETGNRKLTCKFATATAVGQSEFPPREGGGTAPRYQITFDLHMGSGVTSLATAIVDAVDA